MTSNHDVVVVGAGPTGLMLACELRLAGVDVLVLDRLAEPDLTTKAGSITLPTAAALDRRGLLPDLVAAQERALAQFRAFLATRTGPAAGPRTPPPKFLGHFGALMLDGTLLDESDPAFAGHGPAADVGLVPQQELEALLTARATSLGVEIRRSTPVTAFEPDADGVTISASDERLRAGWLVGCDGGRSEIRKNAGFDFPGTPPQITAWQAVAEMTGTEGLRPGWNRSARGVYAFGPMPGRILVVEFSGSPADRDTPVTPDELQGAIRRVTGVDVTVTGMSSITRFTDNARQATDYRRGRVLLAGDAAHVHSPFGGQGLNLGIGDAVNLGWKLAAVVRGWAPDGLLDTYTAERHPVGARVLAWTRAQIGIMRSDPWADALRDLVADLANTTDGTTYLVKQLSGATIRYPLAGTHPLIGFIAPDLALADGSRLAEHCVDGTGVLVDLTGDPAVRAAAAGYPGRVTLVTTTSTDRPGLAGLLVRPDGVVAWAADRDEPDPAEGLSAALRTWFGAPLSEPAPRRSEPVSVRSR
ncbi:FAD-dependent oxidoreductase [Cryptosporangium phraense]|uniref:FAD-dependent oxidoreductase n=1 Tax=Cryptosporangium phraense TaxID=2593070 RepID=A0A545AHU2_9ACTN|nr:FAD-dependent oxidoreductase [Cryptosporangium phraense]TQS40893.1 FAD-dependent oxidoreductase [Cryptosporangium phraense]